MSDHFQLVSKFQPNGDQPTAIAQLKELIAEQGLGLDTNFNCRVRLSFRKNDWGKTEGTL